MQENAAKEPENHGEAPPWAFGPLATGARASGPGPAEKVKGEVRSITPARTQPIKIYVRISKTASKWQCICKNRFCYSQGRTLKCRTKSAAHIYQDCRVSLRDFLERERDICLTYFFREGDISVCLILLERHILLYLRERERNICLNYLIFLNMMENELFSFSDLIRKNDISLKTARELDAEAKRNTLDLLN